MDRYFWLSNRRSSPISCSSVKTVLFRRSFLHFDLAAHLFVPLSGSSLSSSTSQLHSASHPLLLSVVWQVRSSPVSHTSTTDCSVPEDCVCSVTGFFTLLVLFNLWLGLLFASELTKLTGRFDLDEITLLLTFFRIDWCITCWTSLLWSSFIPSVSKRPFSVFAGVGDLLTIEALICCWMA